MQGVRQRSPCRPRVLLENVSLISGQVLDAWVLAVMPRSLKMENRTSQWSTEGQRRLCCSRDVSEEAPPASADVSTAVSWPRLPADVLPGVWCTISAEALDVRLIWNSILALSHNPVLWAIEKDVEGGVPQMRARLTNVGSSATRTGGRVQSWQRCMGRRTTFSQQCVSKKGSTSQSARVAWQGAGRQRAPLWAPLRSLCPVGIKGVDGGLEYLSGQVLDEWQRVLQSYTRNLDEGAAPRSRSWCVLLSVSFAA